MVVVVVARHDLAIVSGLAAISSDWASVAGDMTNDHCDVTTAIIDSFYSNVLLFVSKTRLLSF